jgi:hypothetical protein
MLIIPIRDVYAQSVDVTVGGQACTLLLRQKSTGFFCSLYVDGTLIIGGVICQNRNRIVRDAYLGFVGDFVFFDTSGAGADPSSPGLGTRFLLFYLDPADIP